jgi:hypothetical protein
VLIETDIEVAKLGLKASSMKVIQGLELGAQGNLETRRPSPTPPFSLPQCRCSCDEGPQGDLGRRTCACWDPVLASRTCPVCRKVPIHDRQEVCSGRCRAARSRQRRVEAQREGDAAIRDLLEAALKKLQEGVP